MSEPRWWRSGGQRRLDSKLVRVFLLQVLAISVAAALGVWVAAHVVENVLVRQALEGEAEHYWRLYRQNDGYPLPNTANMTGYMTPAPAEGEIPEAVAREEPGFHELAMDDGTTALVHVSAHDGKRLHLVFNEMQVSRLALLFGIAPLIGALMVIYFLTWLGYVSSRRAVSPLVRLARQVEDFDFSSGDTRQLQLDRVAAGADTDTLTLIRAFRDFADRLDAFIERERNFTRNASHELRTPLAVLQANLELLEQQHNPEQRQVIEQRMRRTVSDMQGLIEALLLLARERESRLSWQPVDVNSVVERSMCKAREAYGKDSVDHRLVNHAQLRLRAPEQLLTIVLDNILRNAFLYTDEGEVIAEVGETGVAIQDSGRGMTEADLERAFEPFYRGDHEGRHGYGLGLAIVKRICWRFEWTLDADSELGEGTRIDIEFPRDAITD